MDKAVFKKRAGYFLFSCIFMFGIFAFCKCMNLNRENQVEASSASGKKQSVDAKSSNEMIGIWVSYLDLSICSKENTESKFKEKFDDIVLRSKENGINTLFVHVRPFSDALYPSEIFPWSHLLTGTQGENPGFDPLEYMVKASHENGLKFHAWVNPLRLKLESVPENLCSESPQNKFADSKYFINYTGGTYFNPAYPEIRNMITDGVKEIAENYSVDGIHFDDYFYPEVKFMTSEDTAYKERTKTEKTNLEAWRKQNINLLIKDVYKAVKTANRNIEFGISPCGNIKKCEEAGADVRTWASKTGFVDYILPQLYWSPQCPALPFEKAAKSWAALSRLPQIKLYAGLALYKAGTAADCETWQSSNNILAQEFKASRKLNYKGAALFSYSYLNKPETTEEISNFKKEIV